jgi:Hemerythrin HHE cation binding domain
MPSLGDMVGAAHLEEMRSAAAGLVTFCTDRLLPHLEAAESTLYPELERILQNRHSMTPLRREHTEIRSLVAHLQALDKKLAVRALGPGETLELRRVIFRLYALLKVHLAEEQLYSGILEHAVEAERSDRLAAALQHARSVEL